MLYKGFRNLIPDVDTKDVWLAANKGDTPLEIGERHKLFRFPGCWTVKNYNGNVSMFWIAMFFEIAFLLLIFTQAGIQLFLVITSLLSVIIDFISALAHNSKRKEITKERLELSSLKYLRNLQKFTDPLQKVTDPQVRDQEEVVKKYENNVWRWIGRILIVISWLVKIFVTTVTFGLPIIIFASVVIFGFVAYIHLFHTGYAFLGSRFYSKLNKIAKKSGNKAYMGKDTDADFDYIMLGTINDVTLFEIKHKVEDIDINVYDSLVKMDDGTWAIKKWKYQFWDDEDIENFIKSSDEQYRALSPDAQAFLLYKIYECVFRPQI